jgi:succinate dehydrogenase hydrophobic anchor subunit
MKNKQMASSGIGLSTIVFLIFLVMKLAEIGVVATWSWWWVCSPLWIPVLMALGVVVIVFGIIGLVTVFDNYQKRRRLKKIKNN